VGGETVAWRFRRAVTRVAAVEAILAEYATDVCGLPVRRQEVHGDRPGVRWSIGGETMVELVVEPEGPDTLLVRELSLLGSVRKAVRTRHLKIDYVSG
jgi:hypothetical protein